MTVYINAISGLTPFGNLEETWKGITDNKVCYGNPTKFPWDKYTRSKVGGEVKFDAEEYSSISERDREKMPQYMQWALASAQELLDGKELDKERTGVIVSSSLSTYLESIRANENDIDNAFTFTPNMISNNINIQYGFTGPSTMTTSACSTGIYSIIMGCMLIETGQADNIIAGAFDDSMSPIAYKQFGKLRALSTKYNNTPHKASRPWDTKRDGLVLSEGGAMFLLSNTKTSDTLAEISGYTMNNDAYQVVAPHPDGTMIEKCMRDTLKGRIPDLINAHATSTPMGDYIEIDALNRLGLQDVWVTANKSQIGHLMGAAGAIETALSVLSLKHGIITPSLNIEHLENNYDIKYTPTAKNYMVNSVLCNSFGFGGSNASILLSKT
jgi:3-oxoacyl-[acyl-carrier-protein] synthase II|tara:strand:+ start:266 stop:1417 length:1152 start_codon:yes stop_codon:yes gene_type:complete